MINWTRTLSKTLLLALGVVALGCGEEGSADDTVTSAISGQTTVAFQGANHDLWYESGPGTGVDTQIPMTSGTVPSQVALPGGGVEVGFQKSNGHFLLGQLGGGFTDSGGLMLASPSITLLTNGDVATGIQGTNGDLWVSLTGAFGGKNTGGVLASGTSPSLAGLPNGQLALAIHGSNGDLWLGLNGPTSGVDTRGLMAGGTSPSIAALPPSFGNQVAFAMQGSNGHLWFGKLGPTSGFDTQQPMKAGTSPSVAVGADGTAYVAFQANTGNLWLYAYNNGATVTPFSYAMAPGASPSIRMTSAGLYQISFKGSNGDLFVLLQGQLAQDQGYAMN